MKKRLVIISDCTDIAFSEIRATIIKTLGNKSKKIEIEPLVPVFPFSLINGNFILRLMAECYPAGTIFSIVLNPLRERKERLIIRTQKKNLTVFTTNTGVLEWLIRDFGCKAVYEINDPGFIPFGGKYVHAPAVGKFLAGENIKKIAKPFDRNKVIPLNIEEGTIVHIDNFGLIKIFYDPKKLVLKNEYSIKFKKRSLNTRFVERLMSLKDGEWGLFRGSSMGLLELGCARRNGAELLGLNVGDKIEIKKNK